MRDVQVQRRWMFAKYSQYLVILSKRLVCESFSPFERSDGNCWLSSKSKDLFLLLPGCWKFAGMPFEMIGG